MADYGSGPWPWPRPTSDEVRTMARDAAREAFREKFDELEAVLSEIKRKLAAAIPDLERRLAELEAERNG